MVMIGIDLGTTNSLAVAFVDGQVVLIPNAFEEFLTPSVVHLSNGELIVGKLAKERLVTAPHETVQLFKRHMGSETVFELGDQTYSATALSAMVVKQLVTDAERFLGETVDEVVISVPAYFNDQQRQATKAIGEVLGLKVERLINEPSAAAIACHKFGIDETFIVFDFGGGTLDVSVVDCFDNMVSICAIAGDNELGGADFDQALATHFCDVHDLDLTQEDPQAYASLLLAAERCKLTLQTQEQAYLSLVVGEETLGLKVTREIYRQLMLPILAKVRGVIARAVRESGVESEDFDAFVLVGGSSLMPLVQDFLKDTLNLPLKRLGDMDQLVAQGLGTYLGIKGRKEPVKSIVVTDVCPFSLGVACFDEEFQQTVMSKIIHKNTVLPTSAKSCYMASRLGQSEVTLKIYQGESLNPELNIFLGSLTVPIPINHKRHEGFEVTFSYDLNALLYIEVRILSTDKLYRYRLGQNQQVEAIQDSQILEQIKQLSLKLTKEPYYDSLVEKAYRIHAELPQTYQYHLEKNLLYVINYYKGQGHSLKQKRQLLQRFDRQLIQLERLVLGLGSEVFKDWLILTEEGEDDDES